MLADTFVYFSCMVVTNFLLIIFLDIHSELYDCITCTYCIALYCIKILKGYKDTCILLINLLLSLN